MIDVTVEMVLTDPEPFVDPATELHTAADRLRDPEVPALLVRDAGGGLAGVLTESDVVAAVGEGAFEIPVEECMSTPPVTVGPETSIGLAADRMRDAGVSTLPIVDCEGGYHGLVTHDDLAPYLTRQRLEITWDGEPLRIE